MRDLLAGSLAAAALSFTLGGAAVAQTDPTVHQIYEAASSGHLDRAQGSRLRSHVQVALSSHWRAARDQTFSEISKVAG